MFDELPQSIQAQTGNDIDHQMSPIHFSGF
jgi:hypothetical protein